MKIMKVKNRNFVVVGVSFRKTGVEIRNKFAFSLEKIQKIYEEQNNISSPFFVLSTCNRTEIYGITENIEEFIGFFTQYNSLKPAEVKSNVYIKSDEEAIKHLLFVASGLDSQILGDREITGQLKKTFALAKSYGCTNGMMEKLLNTALQSSREIKQQTLLSDGTTTISYSVIQLLKEEMKDKGKKICLIGLGKIGMLTLKNLRHYLPDYQIVLVNRNEVTMQEAAKEYAVEFIKFENRKVAMTNCDALIVATGADHSIISREEIETSGVKLILDLSIPSNVSEEVKLMSDVKYFNIDIISKIVNQTLENRKNEIPLAETIIEQHFRELKEWEERRKFYTAKKEILTPVHSE